MHQLTEADLRSLSKRFNHDEGTSHANSSAGASPKSNEFSGSLFAFSSFYLPCTNHSRNDRIEFEAFCPYLIDFFATTLVKFTVISVIIKLIDGEIYRQLSESDKPLPIEEIPRLSLTVHSHLSREIKNLIETFVHGSKHSQQNYSPTTYYQLSEFLRRNKKTALEKSSKQVLD